MVVIAQFLFGYVTDHELEKRLCVCAIRLNLLCRTYGNLISTIRMKYMNESGLIALICPLPRVSPLWWSPNE